MQALRLQRAKREAGTPSFRGVLQVLSAQPQRQSVPPSSRSASVPADCDQAASRLWRQTVVRCCEKLTTLDARPVTQSERTRGATLRRDASQDLRAVCKDIAGVLSSLSALHAQHALEGHRSGRRNRLFATAGRGQSSCFVVSATAGMTRVLTVSRHLPFEQHPGLTQVLVAGQHHRDALHPVFQRLPAADLVQASLVCKHWRDAALPVCIERQLADAATAMVLADTLSQALPACFWTRSEAAWIPVAASCAAMPAGQVPVGIIQLFFAAQLLWVIGSDNAAGELDMGEVDVASQPWRETAWAAVQTMLRKEGEVFACSPVVQVSAAMECVWQLCIVPALTLARYSNIFLFGHSADIVV